MHTLGKSHSSLVAHLLSDSGVINNIFGRGEWLYHSYFCWIALLSLNLRVGGMRYQLPLSSFYSVNKCCVFRPANPCLGMRLHGWKRWKTFENHEKSTFSIMRTRGSCKAREEKRFASCTWDTHVEKRTKSTKYQMSSQCLGVNQLLGVIPNRWLTNFFLRFSPQALHEPLVRKMENVLFSWFSNVFHCFRPCEHMRKHAFCWSKNTTDKRLTSSKTRKELISNPIAELILYNQLYVP